MTTTTQLHCQECGQPNEGDGDGYTTCCNQILIWGGCSDACYHDHTNEESCEDCGAIWQKGEPPFHFHDCSKS